MSAIPKRVAERIVERCGEGEPLVIIPRHGKPARVYGLAEYLKMRGVPKRHKPWTRRVKTERPNPLGAVKGRVLGSLSRKHIYD